VDTVLLNWAPRGEAMTELARLGEAEHELQAKLSDVGQEQRAAGDDVARVSGELTELEARAARGEQVLAKERTALEQRLAAARSRAAQPWEERRAALHAVARERQAATHRHAAEHFGVLLEEIETGSVQAADRVDAALRELLDAVAERAAAARRVEALVILVRGRTAFGDVPPSRADAVAREAERLLGEGGEPPPLLRPELRADSGSEAPELEEPEPATAA
jgi:hypothetical protein